MNLPQNDTLMDGRNDLPIFIHSELDDLDIGCEAFRVYGHLARRVGRNGGAWPSYQSIGDVCFAKDYPNSKATRRKHAIAAIKELIELGLIFVQKRRTGKEENMTNVYTLTPKSNWKRSGGSAPTELGGGSHTALGSAPTAPKGTPTESKLTKYSKSLKAHDYALARENSFPLPDGEDGQLENEYTNGFADHFEGSTLDINANSSHDLRVPQFSLDKKNSVILTDLPVDIEGWIALPTDDRYNLARFIATRRMQFHLLAIAYEAVPFLIYRKSGKYVTKGRQMELNNTEYFEGGWEDEVLASNGSASLRLLRDWAYARNQVSQEEFNRYLRHYFMQSQRFLLKKNAKKLFDTTPIAMLFDDGFIDRERLKIA